MKPWSPPGPCISTPVASREYRAFSSPPTPMSKVCSLSPESVDELLVRSLASVSASPTCTVPPLERPTYVPAMAPSAVRTSSVPYQWPFWIVEPTSFPETTSTAVCFVPPELALIVSPSRRWLAPEVFSRTIGSSENSSQLE